jgi:predicted dehydrogenase
MERFMNIKPNIGIVGAGMWGCRHIKTIQDIGRADVTWIVDAKQQVVDSVQKEYNIPNGSTDMKMMLADKNLDAVIISSPPFAHFEQSINALKAEKHLILEKPVALNRSEGQKLLAEAKKHKNCKVLVGTCRDSILQPKFEFIKNFIDSGKIGEIYHINFSHMSQNTFIEYNPQGTWALNKKLAGGGPLVDWGGYDLAFHMSLINNKFTLDKAYYINRNDLRDFSSKAAIADVEQHVVAFLKFKEKLTFTYERGAGVHMNNECETRIYGTRGGIKFSYYPWEKPFIDYYHAGPEGKDPPQYERIEIDMKNYRTGNIDFINHAIDCISGKANPILTLKEAMEHMEIIWKLLEA